MTSYIVTWLIDDVTNRRAVGTFLQDMNPPNHLVSEILTIKVADTHTERQTDIATDNKCRLKLNYSRASQ